MKDEQKVWVRGVEDRGSEVIKMLEYRGGMMAYSYGDNPNNIYFIQHDGDIAECTDISEMAKIIMDNYRELELGQWKDGDVLISKDGDSFAIFRRYEPDFTFSSSLEATGYVCKEYSRGSLCYVGLYRLATPSEVERFHDLLHRHGKEWDTEKKQLVDWRWKPKNGEAYYFIDSNTSVYETAYDENNINDSLNVEVGNCFRTREEAEDMAAKVKKLLKGGDA